MAQLPLLKLMDLEYLGGFLNPPWWMIALRGFTCGLGAPLGDLTGSFLKRRFAIGSGRPFWLIDQLDFIIVTILLNIWLFPFNFFNIALLLVMTPSIAIYANNVAYMIGRKKEPW